MNRQSYFICDLINYVCIKIFGVGLTEFWLNRSTFCYDYERGLYDWRPDKKK